MSLSPQENFARHVGELQFNFATCAAPAYIAAHGEPAHPRELARHRCINHFSPRTGETVEWVFCKDSERVQAVFPGHLSLEDENSQVTAAESGLGIAQMPAFVVKEAMERGKYCARCSRAPRAGYGSCVPGCRRGGYA